MIRLCNLKNALNSNSMGILPYYMSPIDSANQEWHGPPQSFLYTALGTTAKAVQALQIQCTVQENMHAYQRA